MADVQAGVLAPIPRHARYLCFSAAHDADPRAALCALAALADGDETVVGLGASLVQTLGQTIEGLRSLPALSGKGARLDVPSTPAALWCWLRGDERGACGDRAEPPACVHGQRAVSGQPAAAAAFVGGAGGVNASQARVNVITLGSNGPERPPTLHQDGLGFATALLFSGS